MAADVAQKVITANPIKADGAVIYVNKAGTKQVIRVDINKTTNDDALFALYGNKFDDITYYSN